VSAGDAPQAFVIAGGSTPLVISFPHSGTAIPAQIAARLSPLALAVPDTDWHVPLLYGFARERGATLIEARLSRYVVDLNRPPDDGALYPGQVSTGLCPASSFAGEALYTGAAPDAAEIAARREQWWAPYHAALDTLVASTCARHGHCVLLDAHSIRAQVPRLFEGRLPDLNLGSNDGRSCDAQLARVALQALSAQQAFTVVRDGRFKGGYITRSRGRPAAGVHALQLEIAQSAYMDEASGEWQPQRAAPLAAVLGRLVDVLLDWRSA
jgi:N-formylglutamate deformylase